MNTDDSLNIVHLIENQARLDPGRIAISDDEESAISYGDLLLRAEQFSSTLQNTYQVGAGDAVVLHVSKKTIEVFIAIIGTLKASAVYVPINPDHPQSMRDAILHSIKPKCIVTQGQEISGWLNNNIDLDHLNQFPIEPEPPMVVSPGPVDHLTIAYIIYTSGTTGTPKGVPITHANLLETYRSWEEVYKLSPDDNHLQMANISFDVFTGDWVRALCSGGTLVLCQTQVLMQPDKLYEIITTNKITIAEFVPATLNKLVSYLEKIAVENRSDRFRVLICGSDLWKIIDCKRLLQCLKYSSAEATVYNSYGVTEATIDSSYFLVDEDSLAALRESDLVPIGKPFPHVELRLLNENQEAVPPGEVGEIFIGGHGVSPYGYRGQPELTAKRFVPDQQNTKNTLYRTGDLATMEADNCFALLGRNEQQVNINGKRVELPAIESILSAHEQFDSALVIPDESIEGKITLNAYLVLGDSKRDDLSHESIIFFLKEHLPKHCIPAHFFLVSSIPLTSNGKVNRKLSAIRGNLLSEISPRSDFLPAQPIVPSLPASYPFWKKTPPCKPKPPLLLPQDSMLRTSNLTTLFRGSRKPAAVTARLGLGALGLAAYTMWGGSNKGENSASQALRLR